MSNVQKHIDSLSPQQPSLRANALSHIPAKEQSEPIAIIGMGCRLPGGVHDGESFWELLSAGRDAIREVPQDRWDVDAYYDPNPDAPGRMVTRWGGFIDNPDLFDPKFFGIAPAEATAIDPQHRLLLETAWEAIEDSGINPTALTGSKTGVFVGIYNTDFFGYLAARCSREQITPYFASGLSHAVAAGRISYLLGLRGPSMAVDTSCSSSLMAVHLACQSLRRAESDLALAGGANLILIPEVTIALSRSRMMSPEGRCKVFSDRANGYVRSEGSGIVVLKRLSEAIEDRDRILGVIRGTAVNHVGKGSGLMAPLARSQEAVMRDALLDAGMRPDEIQYVEAHGTGTAVGDPVEIAALAGVFADRPTGVEPLRVGSVKSNLGHMESAAGIAGLLKLVLALRHKEIPASLHLERPSRRIDWSTIPIQLCTSRQPWPASAGKRAGCVNSFGFSGANVHAVVEQAPKFADIPDELEHKQRPMLFPLSAKSETALRTAAGRLSTYLSRQRDMSLHGIARTLQSGRAHFEYRLAVVANSHDNLIDSLKNIDEISHCDFVSLPGKERNPRVAFLFENDSPQFAHVARGLYEASPIFRESIIRCDEIMAPEIGVSVADLLSQGKNHESRHLDGQCRSVTSFAVQYGVALLWQSCGLEPAFTFGVGTGACLAACIAKAVELKDALLLAGKLATAGSKAPHPPEPAVAFKKPKVPWYVDDATEPWIQAALSANIALPHAQSDFLNHQVLLSMGSSYDPNWLGRGQMEPPSTTTLATLGSNGDDLESFMHAAARLYKIGCNLDLTRFYSQSRAIPVSLPTYPFERVRCWPEVEQGFVGNSSQTRLTPSVASVIKEVPETESPSTSEIPLELHPIPESASTKANSAAPTSVEESASGIAETQSIAELVMSAACAALGCPKGESLPLDVPLIELGMDSLMAMDLVDRLEKATGLTMPLKVTFGYESVADVIQMIETMHWVAEDHQDGKEQVQDEIHI